MRRFLMVSLAVLLAGGCGGLRSPEEEATDRARDRARSLWTRLDGGRVWSAQDMGHRVQDIGRVDVMRVTGTTTGQGDGVGVVIRTSAVGHGAWGRSREIKVVRCFELRFSVESRMHGDVHDVDCPAGRPLTFRPWPKTPEIPYERVRQALPRVPAGGKVDERKVRRALDSLDLDPAIHTEIKVTEGVAGVSLWVKPYLAEALDCVLGRVAPGRTAVWSPSRIQRMPGEGGCDVAAAIHPMPPPH